jgi:uncharacterized repeat protein (TIGR03837 family)
VAAQARYWQALGVPPCEKDELRVSLFSYENPAIPGLLADWVAGDRPVTCLLPEGRALPQVASFLGRSELQAGASVQQGSLRVQVLPFVEQERYDELLWACDINFVRGEDSFVRAQWAGKPFVWHIYPQHDGVHIKKLHAFLERFGAGLSDGGALAVRRLWDVWNGVEGTAPVAPSWNQFLACQSMLLPYCRDWAQQLAANNLALNLLDFCRETGKIRPFEI